MDFIIEQLTGPSNPSDFVGRNDLIKSFQTVLLDFVRSQDNVHWVHISSESGSGKSSLLRKFRMMTEQERIATGSVEVPISPYQADQFLTNIKLMIDEMAPEWRSFIRKKTNAEITGVISPPETNQEEITEEYLDKMVDIFFEDLDKIDKKMKEKKMRNAIFLDDLDRFLNYNYKSILYVIPRIMKRLKDNNYNLFFVTTSHNRADRYLRIEEGIAENYALHIELSQFDFKEAELMIRRKGKLVKSERERVVQSSTRYPFDLALRQLIHSKGGDPANLDLKSIALAFDLNRDEIAFLKDIARSEINFYSIDEFSIKYNHELIENFKNMLLINISQDDYFAITSNALWELIIHVFKPTDARTEAILILNRIKTLSNNSQLPLSSDLTVLKNHFTNIDDNGLIFELSGQVAETAKIALKGDLVKTAWNLLNLATLGLERTEDNEKIADLHETLAKSFADADYNYFAAKTYERAGKYYSKAGIEWRAASNYREAALRYLKELEQIDIKLYHYAVRNIYKSTITAFINANESKRARSVAQEAKKVLKDYEQHVRYFDNLIEIRMKVE